MDEKNYKGKHGFENDKKAKEILEREYVPDYYPVEIRSAFLLSMIAKVDNYIMQQEDIIDKQSDTIDNLQKAAGDRLNQDLEDGHKMMTNVLSACIGTPSVNSLGPVGATVIAKIRDMTKIEDVQNYIESIVKDNQKELEKDIDK